MPGGDGSNRPKCQSNQFRGVMERRRHERYPVAPALNFLWTNPEGVPYRAKGLVRDMSESGIFVLADQAPPVGTPVGMEVLVRSVWARSQVVIELEGEVVRVEARQRGYRDIGFAAVVRNVVLHNEQGEIPG